MSEYADTQWFNQVYLGSSEHMDKIPERSVACCVTSPPYYGLREYGTGDWVGGDPSCPHSFPIDQGKTSARSGRKRPQGHPSQDCKCGALREANEQIGHEATVAAYVERLVTVFREVRHKLRDDGTLWLNVGDSYAGSGCGPVGNEEFIRGKRDGSRWGGSNRRVADLPAKNLIGIPWRIAFALQADGWWLRDAIVWAKPNPMPSSVTDRCTSSYEMVFMLAKSKTYFADMDAVRETLAESSVKRFSQPTLDAQAGSERANGGAKTNGTMKAVYKHDKDRVTSQQSANRVWDDPDAQARILANGANLRNVWTIPTTPYFGDHPAVMPRALATRCILIGYRPNDIILDPFMGSGTVAECAIGNGRRFVGYEISEKYHAEIAARLGLFGASA